MRVLFIGDVVGKPGREGLAAAMPALREAAQAGPGRSSTARTPAEGSGSPRRPRKEIFATGADAITLGNHAYRHREVYPYLDAEQRIVRPANFPDSNPGRGHTIVDAAGMKVAVVNLSGSLHLRVERSPFPAADEILERAQRARPTR